MRISDWSSDVCSSDLATGRCDRAVPPVRPDGEPGLTMVRLDPIYTRGGDAGETSLGSGARVATHDLRVAPYAPLAQPNTQTGLARLPPPGQPDTMLARLPHKPFHLGHDLCTPTADPTAPPSTEAQPGVPAPPHE